MDLPICNVHRLGVVPYEEAWDLQKRLAGEIAAGTRPPTLLLLEHPHTFTFGSRGREEHLLWGPSELKQRGVAVHWVDRGGDVTYHGPGQLVGYPLLPLDAGRTPVNRESDRPRQPRVDTVGYLRKLERTLIRALAILGIKAMQRSGLTGVWVQANGHLQATEIRTDREDHLAKIASIGVKVDGRGISRHGFALNVSPELSYWQGIIGCGLKDVSITNLAALCPGGVPDMGLVMDAVETAFGPLFGYQLVAGKSI